MAADLTALTAEMLRQFLTGIVQALPQLLGGLLFLAVAFVAIRLVKLVLRTALAGVYPEEEQLIVDFGVLVAGVFLWFGAALVLLKILGLGDVAASLGTAAGFVALGVSYALSEMIEDTVAGVYLLRDPDFNPGDTVTAADVTGEVTEIGLRKSRFRQPDGTTVVLANRDVESRWTKQR